MIAFQRNQNILLLVFLKNILNLLDRYGKYSIAIPIILVGVILQRILVSIYLPNFLSFSDGLMNPDQLFSYDLPYLERLYQKLGEDGRKYYAEMLGIDFIFAFIMATGLSLLLSALNKTPKWYFLLPCLLALSDFLENASQLLLLNLYPKLNVLLSSFSSYASSMKMSLSLACLLLVTWHIFKRIMIWFRQIFRSKADIQN